MSDIQLRQSLTELRSELERIEAEEAEVRERLDALIAGIEMRLDTPGDVAHHHSLVRDLRRSILQLEVSHPRATSILNQIMAALGNIGT
jgi:3-methyladenine DNA glycosylase/8-oxoguanine DNA glycosylase